MPFPYQFATRDTMTADLDMLADRPAQGLDLGRFFGADIYRSQMRRKDSVEAKNMVQLLASLGDQQAQQEVQTQGKEAEAGPSGAGDGA